MLQTPNPAQRAFHLLQDKLEVLALVQEGPSPVHPLELARDLAQAMELIQHHLPPHQRQKVLRKSKKYYAYYGVKLAGQLWQRLHSRQVVQAQVRQALQLHQAPRLYLKIAQVYVKIFLHTVWR